MTPAKYGVETQAPAGCGDLVSNQPQHACNWPARRSTVAIRLPLKDNYYTMNSILFHICISFQ